MTRLRDLHDLNPSELKRINTTDLTSDSYVGARGRVDDAMRMAGTSRSERIIKFAQQAQGLLSIHHLPSNIEQAANDVVSAILVRNMPGQERDLATIYAPFEPVIPLASLK